MGFVILGGYTCEVWLLNSSVFKFSNHVNPHVGGYITYFTEILFSIGDIDGIMSLTFYGQDFIKFIIVLKA